jgi:DNA-directed RNA polymerase subunit K/omega
MIDRTGLHNSFEFVVIAGARAKQLMRGAVRRVDDSRKPITVAQREVSEGLVERIAQAPVDASGHEHGDA